MSIYLCAPSRQNYHANKFISVGGWLDTPQREDRAKKQPCVVAFEKRAYAIHGTLSKNTVFFEGFTNATTQGCFRALSVSARYFFLSLIEKFQKNSTPYTFYRWREKVPARADEGGSKSIKSPRVRGCACLIALLNNFCVLRTVHAEEERSDVSKHQTNGNVMLRDVATLLLSMNGSNYKSSNFWIRSCALVN